MSLINEALRKARKEAAERDADDRGATYRPPRAHLPAERSWMPALAGVALGAVLAAAAFFFLMPRTSPEPDSAPEPVAATSVTTDPDAKAPEVGVETEPVSGPDPTETTPPEPASTPARPSEPEPVPSRSVRSETESGETVQSETAQSESEPTAQEPEPEQESQSAESRRIQPPAQVGRVGEQTYVLEAQIGGVALRLDFIVWSASPFAQINGRQVSVGQTVDGFLVREISREDVTLEGEDGPFRLRVR